MIDVNRALYYVLITGMVVSTTLFVLGLVAAAIPSLQAYADFVLLAATVTLIATPVTRTLVGFLVFAYNRDVKFALVSGAVFLVLMVSVTLGFVLHFST